MVLNALSFFKTKHLLGFAQYASFWPPRLFLYLCEKSSFIMRYRCKVCGLIYDPELGDPDSGIEPGTPFEDIPETWSCPICGASKKDFVEMDE